MATSLRDILTAHRNAVLADFIPQVKTSSERYQATPVDEIRRNAEREVELLGTLAQDADSAPAREYIRELCEQRVPRGFRLGEVMQAMFLLQDLVTPYIRRTLRGDADDELRVEDELRRGIRCLITLWADGYYELQSELLDKTERAMRALSVPVIQVWEGVLTVPIVGDVDDARSHQITEDLMDAVLKRHGRIVLLDITGIGEVDTTVVGQLLRTVRSVELLGAECFVVGVTPIVAQTIVTLGIDVGEIATYATLREGLRRAFRTLGWQVVPSR